MNEKAVTKFLKGVLPESHKPFIKYMLVEGRGLESEGWTIEAVSGGVVSGELSEASTTHNSPTHLVFTTPTLVFYPENDPSFTSSSRYKLTFMGFYESPWVSQKWSAEALDKKGWWPEDHPNASDTDICMESDCRNQPDPFIVARAISCMINGYVCEDYEAENYGDIPPEGR